jgi:hypothetical protein
MRTGANDVTAVDESQQPAGFSRSLLLSRQSDHVAPSVLAPPSGARRQPSATCRRSARLPVWGQGGGTLGIWSARSCSRGYRRGARAIAAASSPSGAGSATTAQATAVPLRRDAGADEQHRRETGRQRISRLGRRRHPPDRTRDNLSNTGTARNRVRVSPVSSPLTRSRSLILNGARIQIAFSPLRT